MGKLYPGGGFLGGWGTGTPTLGNGVSITGFPAAVNALVRLNEADQIKRHNFKSYITVGVSNVMGHVGSLPCGQRPTARPGRHVEHGESGGGSDKL